MNFLASMSSMILTTHQADCRKPFFCIPESSATTPIHNFSLAHRPWPVFWEHSLSNEASFCFYSWKPEQGAWTKWDEGRCRFSYYYIGDTHGSGGGIHRWHSSRGSGCASCWGHKNGQQESHSFSALWYLYLPLSQSSPSPHITAQYSELWGREIGFSSSIPCSWGSQALTICSPIHLWENLSLSS